MGVCVCVRACTFVFACMRLCVCVCGYLWCDYFIFLTQAVQILVQMSLLAQHALLRLVLVEVCQNAEIMLLMLLVDWW